MNKRRIIPHSRYENQRQIGRLYSGSGLGLITDMGRVPSGAFGELYNSRDYKTEVRGRQGSFLHTKADYAIFPETITEYVTLDNYFASIGETQDLDGLYFMTYSWVDFTDNSLTLSKNPFGGTAKEVRAYDIFQCKLKQIGLNGEIVTVPYLKYEGNLMPPTIIEGKVSSMYEIKQNNTIQLYNYPLLTDLVLGSYFDWGYRAEYDEETEVVGDAETGKLLQRDYIIGYSAGVGVQTLITQEQEPEEYTLVGRGSTIQTPIYASIHIQNKKRVIILSGENIYYSGLPLDGWKEVNGIYDNYEVEDGLYYKKPFAGESLFHEIKDDILLSNQNGHYRIRIDKDIAHYWKINEQEPTEKTGYGKLPIFGFRDSIPPNGFEIQGFKGYNIETYDDNPVTGNRSGERWFTGGIIIGE